MFINFYSNSSTKIINNPIKNHHKIEIVFLNRLKKCINIDSEFLKFSSYFLIFSFGYFSILIPFSPPSSSIPQFHFEFSSP